MKRLPIDIPLFFALAILLGCDAEPRAGSGQDTTAADTMAADTAPQTPPPPDTTIMISRVDGEIVVQPDSVVIARGRIVQWAAADTAAVWMVLFAESTPMQNRVQVLHNTGPGNPDQAPINREAALGEYKYWVFYPDGQGGYLQLDPKLVIIDD